MVAVSLLVYCCVELFCKSGLIVSSTWEKSFDAECDGGGKVFLETYAD